MEGSILRLVYIKKKELKKRSIANEPSRENQNLLTLNINILNFLYVTFKFYKMDFINRISYLTKPLVDNIYKDAMRTVNTINENHNTLKNQEDNQKTPELNIIKEIFTPAEKKISEKLISLDLALTPQRRKILFEVQNPKKIPEAKSKKKKNLTQKNNQNKSIKTKEPPKITPKIKKHISLTKSNITNLNNLSNNIITVDGKQKKVVPTPAIIPNLNNLNTLDFSKYYRNIKIYNNNIPDNLQFPKSSPIKSLILAPKKIPQNNLEKNTFLAPKKKPIFNIISPINKLEIKPALTPNLQISKLPLIENIIPDNPLDANCPKELQTNQLNKIFDLIKTQKINKTDPNLLKLKFLTWNSHYFPRRKYDFLKNEIISNDIDIAFVNEIWKPFSLYIEGYTSYSTYDKYMHTVWIKKSIDNLILVEIQTSLIILRTQNYNILCTYIYPSSNPEPDNLRNFDLVMGDLNGNTNKKIFERWPFYKLYEPSKNMMVLCNKKINDYKISTGPSDHDLIIFEHPISITNFKKNKYFSKKGLNELMYEFVCKGEVSWTRKISQASFNEHQIRDLSLKFYDLEACNNNAKALSALYKKFNIKSYLRTNPLITIDNLPELCILQLKFLYFDESNKLSTNFLKTKFLSNFFTQLLKKKSTLKSISNFFLKKISYSTANDAYGFQLKLFYDSVKKIIKETKQIIDFNTFPYAQCANDDEKDQVRYNNKKAKSQNTLILKLKLMNLLKKICDDTINKDLIQTFYIRKDLERPNKNEKVILKNDIFSYRMISILPYPLRILENIISKKISKQLLCSYTKSSEDLYQFGFTQGVNCSTAYFLLIANLKAANKPTLGILWDVKRAYDSVKLDLLDSLIQSDANIPIQSKMFLHYYMRILSNLKIKYFEDKIEKNRGLPMGSSLSPSLFNFYLNKCLSQMNLPFNNNNLIAYADDLIQLFYEPEDCNISSGIYSLQKVLSSFGMSLNLHKSTSFLYNPKNEPEININNYHSLKEKGIKHESSFKYLGFPIEISTNITSSHKEVIRLIECKSTTPKTNALPFYQKLMLFRAYVSSKYRYQLSTCIFNRVSTDEAKKILIKFRSFTNYATISYADLIILGLDPWSIIISSSKKALNVLKTMNKDQIILNEIAKINLQYWGASFAKNRLPNTTIEIFEENFKKQSSPIEDAEDFFKKITDAIIPAPFEADYDRCFLSYKVFHIALFKHESYFKEKKNHQNLKLLFSTITMVKRLNLSELFTFNELWQYVRDSPEVTMDFFVEIEPEWLRALHAIRCPDFYQMKSINNKKTQAIYSLKVLDSILNLLEQNASFEEIDLFQEDFYEGLEEGDVIPFDELPIDEDYSIEL